MTLNYKSSFASGLLSLTRCGHEQGNLRPGNIPTLAECAL